MAPSVELRDLAKRVSNWGRWGDEDEQGTANLVDSAATLRGVAAVRSGRRFPLGVPLDEIRSPQEPGGAPGRTNPRLTMISVNQSYTGDVSDACFNDDSVSMATSAGTHLDALAHVTYDGLMYNGFPADLVTAEAGAARCGADKLRPLVTRGVLLDVARALGVERLDPGYPISADDLDAAVEQAKVSPAPGDAVLVRTGQMQLLHEGEIYAYNHDSAGLSLGTVEWVHRHDLGVVMTDTYIFEVWPPEDWELMMAVHMLHLRDMGQVQGQNADLEELAADCASDGVYEFLLVAVPEPITGACSAPVNPVAVK